MFTLALAALYLSSCGGAVEGGWASEEETTEFNFVMGDPKGSVSVACSVTAEFDGEIEASTITDQSFIIESNNSSDPLSEENGNGTWGLSADSNTIALFAPTVSLVGDYTVTVTTAITNTDGIALAGNQSWTFNATNPCPP